MAQRNLFLRDYTKENKHPVGCVSIETDRATNQIRYALSACSPLDKWNSRVASDKATGRRVKSPVVIDGVVPENNYDITRTVMEHIVRTHGEQRKNKSRSLLALLAAQGWLDNNKPHVTDTNAQNTQQGT